MDGARLSEVISRGYGIAARNVGQVFTVYRPASASTPIAAGNALTTLPATFNAHSGQFAFDKAASHRDHLFHGLFDFADIQKFDYFKLGDLVYFVASLEHATPTLCVQCTRTITISRPQGALIVGANPYQGNTPSVETALMTSWPVAAQMQGRSRGGSRDLPGDVGSAKFEITMPSWPGVVIRTADIVVDDLDWRFIVESAELSPYGWRLMLHQAVT